MKNLLLLKGGGGQEHDVSLASANYIKSIIDSNEFAVYEVLVDEDFAWSLEGKKVELNFQKRLTGEGLDISIDLCVPCIHGYPGETGHIQAYLEMINLPFLGCGYEASAICFNKVLTKLWLEKAAIPVTDFMIAKDAESATLETAKDFFEKHGSVFVKASNQGSSVGCYPVDQVQEVAENLNKALSFSDFAIIEKKLVPRELEISVYEYQGELIATNPCEIICPDKFYSYEEKYSKKSKTQTILRAEIEAEHIEAIKKHAKEAFTNLKLSQFCRMDFFLADGQVYLNEINTFPGMTPISMFPKMIEDGGTPYKDVLNWHLKALIP